MVERKVLHSSWIDFLRYERKRFGCKSVTQWVAFVSVSVGVGDSQRIPLSVLARNPHKGLACEISHETGRRRGRARSQDRPGQLTEKKKAGNRAVDRRKQSTEQSSQQEKGVSRSRRRPTVWERRLLEPVDPGAKLVNERGWVSVPVAMLKFRSNKRSR